MKHIKIDGKLINMDKVWKHLTIEQREWICDQFRSTYVEFLNTHNRHPSKNQREEIISSVYAKIQSRGIWVPFNEIKKAFYAKLPRYRMIRAGVVIR